MTIEYIRYKASPEQRDAFIQSYEQASEQLNASKYCLAYELQNAKKKLVSLF